MLRVETDSSSPEAGSWLSATYDAIFGTPPQLVKIKARIPEVHAALPIPEQTGDAPGPHQPIIDLYPTFIAQDTQVEAPKPGDIVNVDFGNKNTWDDPIYLGPLFKSAAGPGALGGIAGAGIFGNCGASQPVAPTPAAQPAPTNLADSQVGVVSEEEQYDLVYVNPPEQLAGFPLPLTIITPPDAKIVYDQLKDKDPSTWDLGTVYVFGDSQTNGMGDAINEYFSGFNINYNNWYGGGYRIAYKNVPEDKVKGKNQGKSIDSYMDQYKIGDTIIIGSIGGNMSFDARKKYPRIGPPITSDPYLVDLPPKLPTSQENAPTSAESEEEGLLDSAIDSAADALGSLFGDEPPQPDAIEATSQTAIKYGLAKLIQDGDNATSFKKFCETLNTLRIKGVNVIIFGLPYGGKESRQEDRVHFDYVQFASLAAEGLGRNYISVMQDSRGLKAGDDDVHYFTGNGGGGYKPYFEKLLEPSLQSFYFQYREELADIVSYAKANEPTSQENLQLAESMLSTPDGEAPSQSEIESLAKTFQTLENTPAPEPPEPTAPAAPPAACIGTVGGATSGGTGGGVTGGSASGGSKFGVDPNPFNGGKQGEIIINGQAYAAPFPIIGSVQFKGLERKGAPTFVTIHNSAGSNGGIKVANYLQGKGLGVHFTVELDGTILQHADPVTQIVYHASGINNDSIGIETPVKVFGPNSKKQAAAGFTLAPEGVWWSNWSAKKGFTVPNEAMVNGCNQLLAFLAAKIPTIQPFFKTFPDNYIGPPELNTRRRLYGYEIL